MTSEFGFEPEMFKYRIRPQESIKKVIKNVLALCCRGFCRIQSSLRHAPVPDPVTRLRGRIRTEIRIRSHTRHDKSGLDQRIIYDQPNTIKTENYSFLKM